MGFWSRIADFARQRSGNEPVGTELFSWMEEAGGTAAGIPVNTFTAMQQVAVMACVTVLSEDVAKLPLRIYRRLDNGGKKVASDHFLHRMLRQPNAWQTRFEFVEMMQASLVLRSNAYAVILRNERGKPEQLVPIHPDRCTLYEAPGGQWFYLVTRQGLHEMAVLEREPLLVPAEDMLHVRGLAMWDSLIGQSRIGMMREAIGLALSQEQQAARLAGTGARPGGVLQTDKKLSKEVSERVRASWQEAHGGWRNTGKTAVLEEGLKWEQLGMTMQDAEFMESQRFSLEQIARGFRVPLHKLGVPSEVPAQSLVQLDQGYINDVLSSYCQRWIEKLEHTFDVDGDELFLEFDFEHMYKADIQTRMNVVRLGTTGMVYRPNEGRRSFGLPDVPGGDILYQPANMVPLGTLPKGNDAGLGSETTGAPAPGGDGDPAGNAPAGDSAPSS